jgi:outer membrane protein TolC
MLIGAGAVAAAYQAKDRELRNLLTSGFEQRIALARQAVASATDSLRATERGISLGTATQEALLEERAKIAETQAQLRSLELQLEEVRITAREPLMEISSPVVSGRDFVSERLRVEMSVPEAARELEQFRLRDSEKRLALGTVEGIDVDASRARVVEVDVAIEAFRKKLETSKSFLAHKIDAPETELRALEIEAEQRRKTLAPKVELARKQSERARVKVQLGTGQSVELAEARLRLQQLETELAKADLDLALVLRRLSGRGASPGQ